MTADSEDLSALVTLSSKARKPATTAAADSGCHSNSLDVGDRGWAAEETNGGGEWRL